MTKQNKIRMMMGAKGLMSTANEFAGYAQELSRLEGKDPNPYGELFIEFNEIIGRIRAYNESVIKGGYFDHE